MSGYSGDWGGEVDWSEEKVKELQFAQARVKLLEKDLGLLEADNKRLFKALEVMRQDRDMYARMWREQKDLADVAEAALTWERSDRWRTFTGGM